MDPSTHIDAPRLPRLGGHQPSPARLPPSASLAIAHGPAPSLEDKEKPSLTSSELDRPFVDVGYDNDGVPLASRRSRSLFRDLTGRQLSEPQPLVILASNPEALSSSVMSAAATPADKWKTLLKEEVLRGSLSPQNPPDATAAAPREELCASRDETDGADTSGFGDDSPPMYTVSDTSSQPQEEHPQQRLPLRKLGSGAVSISIPSLPLGTALSLPKSPVSVAGSTAADTPRSILRHPGSSNGRSSRSGKRQISFVGVSPPRTDREGDDDDDNSDEYEAAEPSLHYESGTPSVFSGNTPPRHARNSSKRDASVLGSVDQSESETDRLLQQRNGSDVDTFGSSERFYELHTSSSSSLVSPRPGRRSATHSPPREPPQMGLLPRPSAAASAPPPPEEEEDEITLDVAPAYRRLIARPQVQPRRGRSPERVGGCGAGLTGSPPRRSPGAEEDILTQPHERNDANYSPSPSVPMMRRHPLSQRWPSDAYLDEPPTEVSESQQSRQARRESIDPEDDMGSLTNSSTSNRTDSREKDSPSPTRNKKDASAKQRTKQEMKGGQPIARRAYAAAPTEAPRSVTQESPAARITGDHLPSPLPKQQESREQQRGRSHCKLDAQESDRRIQPPTECEKATPVAAGEMVDGRLSSDSQPSPELSPSTITDRSSGQSITEDVASPRREKEMATEATAVVRSAPSSQHKDQEAKDVRVELPQASRKEGLDIRTASPTTLIETAAANATQHAAFAVHKEEEATPVHVDPLLYERRQQHERLRPETPTHFGRRASTKNTMASGESEVAGSQASRRHSRRRRVAGRANPAEAIGFEPVSLRDVLMRSGSPSTGRRGPSLSIAEEARAILSFPVHLHPVGAPMQDESVSEGAQRERGRSLTAPLHSSRSIDGVPADQLVWDTPAEAADGSDTVSPLASPRSTSEGLSCTSNGHKILRKKLVVVVRRKKSGVAPSEEDPVVQMSLLPFEQGKAALLHSELPLPNTPLQQRGRDADEATAASLPPLEKLIDHVGSHRGTPSSVLRFRRRLHRDSRGDGDADGSPEPREESDEDEESRRRFRRAMSAFSSRSGTPRSSASPPGDRRSKSTQARTPSPRGPKQEVILEHQSASRDDAEVLRFNERECQHPADAKSPSTALAAASPATLRNGVDDVRRTSESHRNDVGSTVVVTAVTPQRGRTSPLRLPLHSVSRRRNENSSRRHHYTDHGRMRQGRGEGDTATSTGQQLHRLSPASAFAETSLSKSNSDEFYGAADMSRAVADLRSRPPQLHIGITPMSAAHMLPKLALLTAQAEQRQRSTSPATIWPASDDEDRPDLSPTHPIDSYVLLSHEGDRIRPLRTSSATQTDRAAAATVAMGSTRAGMPLLGATPVLHAASLEPVLKEKDSAPALNGADESFGPIPGVSAATAVELPLESGVTVGLYRGSDVTQARGAAPPNTFPQLTQTTVSAPLDMFVKHSTSAVTSNQVGGTGTWPRQAEEFTPSATVPLPHSAALVNDAPQRSFALPAEHGSVSSVVPRYPPPLMVDDVAHLSQEWQTTLRERSSKARQNDMEQFLIASAEAGAVHSAASVPLETTGRTAAMPSPRRAINKERGSSILSEVQSVDVQQAGCSGTPWPVSASQGLPPEEFYGDAVAPPGAQAALSNVVVVPPVAALHSVGVLAPDSKEERRWPSKSSLTSASVSARRRRASHCLSSHRSASAKGGSNTLKASQTAEKSSRSPRSSSTRPEEAEADPPTDSFAVSPAQPLDSALQAGIDTMTLDDAQRAEASNLVEALSRQPLNSRCSPPTPTPSARATLQRPSRLFSPSPPRRGSSQPSEQASTALVTATHDGVKISGLSPPRPVFLVTDPMPVAPPSRAPKPERQERSNHHHHRHVRQEERRHSRSASTSSSVSPSSHAPASKSAEAKTREAKRNPTSENGSKSKHKRDSERHRRRHGRHPKLPLQPNASIRESAFDALEEDSDLDSNLTTSMEFQLTRLLLREQAKVEAAVVSTTASSKPHSRKQSRKAHKKRDHSSSHHHRKSHHHHRRRSKSEGRNKLPHERHRDSRSSSSVPKREERRKGERNHRHRTESPLNVDPLPHPPIPTQEQRLYSGNIKEIHNYGFETESLYQASASRHPCVASVRERHDISSDPLASLRFVSDEHHRFGLRHSSTTRQRFQSSSTLDAVTGSEDAAAAQARRRDAAHSGTFRSYSYERYRRQSPDLHKNEGLLDAFSAERHRMKSASAADEPALRHRSFSQPRWRPSTCWADYVRASRGDSNRRARSPRSSRFGRTSTPVDLRQGYAGRASGSTSDNGFDHLLPGDARHSYAAAYTGRHVHAEASDAIESIPLRQYFNDEAHPIRGNHTRWQNEAAYNYERYRSRSVSASNRDYPYADPYRYASADRHAAARTKGLRQDDALLSTPPRYPEEMRLRKEDRGAASDSQPSRRRGVPPPPPPPSPPPQVATSAGDDLASPPASLSPAPSTVLPIAAEHTVKDAQAAEEFVEGVKGIINALKQYQMTM